jgi:hypothetical protein
MDVILLERAVRNCAFTPGLFRRPDYAEHRISDPAAADRIEP